MSVATRIAGTLAAAMAAVALAAASHVPFPAHRGDDALLRVAWSARPQRIERCRMLSDAELAGVPAHMRQREECESTTATYRLEIRRDGALLDSAALRGGGLRRDRQLYVLRELPLPAGRHAIEVRVTRVETDVPEAGDAPGAAIDRDAEQRRRRAGDEIPALLALHDTVTLAPREVLLVTYDRAARRLRTVRADP